MSHFDERSGIVACNTEWGRWYQTVDELYVEVNLPENTQSKEIKCTFKTRHMKVVVKGHTLIEGDFVEAIHPDDVIWTLEDKKMLRIVLAKSLGGAEHCWRSLLKGQYEADPYLYDQMEQKLTLQRFQLEQPGFDFSGAKISGNYSGGGPQLPSS